MFRRASAAAFIVLFTALPALAAVCDLTCAPAAATETCPGHQQPPDPLAPSGCSHDHDASRAVLRGDIIPKLGSIEYTSLSIVAGPASATVVLAVFSLARLTASPASELAILLHPVPLRI